METNAIRILESKYISHSIIEYKSNDEEIDAVSVANKIGALPEIVFKTLVARNELNETFRLYDKIYCSAGVRGIQVNILPSDLVLLINADFTDLI